MVRKVYFSAKRELHICVPTTKSGMVSENAPWLIFRSGYNMFHILRPQPPPCPSSVKVVRWRTKEVSDSGPMAAIDSALCSSPKDELTSDGFMYKIDAEAGHRVEEMEVNSIPFASEAGLQFYKINVLDDPVCFSIKHPLFLTPPSYLLS